MLGKLFFTAWLATLISGCAGGVGGGSVANAPPSDLQYATNPANYVFGTAITPNTPSSARIVLKYSVSPALPQGLTLDPLTGVISGTPVNITPSAVYKIQATNPYGSAFYPLQLAITDHPPTISYGGATTLSYTVGTVISPITPTLGGGATVACQSIPSLPSGLNLSTACVLSGTPTVAAPTPAVYQITAINSGGSAALPLNIKVIDIPPVFTYTSSTFSLVRGQAVPGGTPNSTGGVITSCASVPTLPAGITLGTDCKISGTPTAIAASASYTITGTNSGGSYSPTSLTLDVHDVAPAFTYSPSTYSFTLGQAITAVAPSSTGGYLASCSSSPALPAGLSLSSACVISGTPTALSGSQSYTITGTNTAGSANATVTIAVNDVAPTILYLGSPYLFTHGTAIPTITPHTGGGAIVACTSSPTLPAGLSLSSACALSGTPTVSTALALYTITATNSGGTGSTTIAIKVNAIAPNISYSGSPFTWNKAITITNQAPNNSGDAPTSCASSPTLPAGLSLSSACVISGTPTAITATASYTITGANSLGSSSTTIQITVNDTPPAISYAGSPFVYTKGVAISTLTPTSTGGPITSCSSSPALPTGLSVSSACVISGTPSAIAAAANYTITATGPGGNGSAVINITVNDAAPSISYSGSPFTFTKGTAITNQTPTNTGGAITSCASSPTLPSGLSLSSACVLSGTPTAVSASASYTVTATNTGGSSSANITITVNDAVPVISYSGSPFTFTKGTAITNQTPTNTGGAITGCSSSPTLPGGLSLSSTCVLSGTPTAITATATYTITATNTGGSGTASISITVNDVAPTLSYTGSPFTYSVGTAITTLTPTNTGGAITGCSSSPILPAGLNLSSACVITGTPTTPSGATAYTITASNTGGSANASITITVNNVAPVISYSGSPFTFTNGTAITNKTPTNTGGAITSCSSTPVLPAGLSLSTACVISGTPTVVSAATAYTITATNAIGNGTASINITINDVAPAISWSPSTVAEVLRTAISTLTPVNTGGAITGCSSSPALPAGLALSASCVITGTPTAISASTAYSITATNTGGTSSATINIQVKNQPIIAFHSLTNMTAGTWNGAAPSSKNIWTVTQDGVDFVKLTQNTNASLDSINPGFGPAGASIVFNSLRDQTGATNGATSTSYDIWTSTITGTSPAHLTANTNASLNSDDPPVVSPDGTKVVYASMAAINGTTNGIPSASYNIFVMNMNGTGTPTALTQNTNAGLDSRAPVWSPDGTMIYFHSMMNLNGVANAAANANNSIWRINATGTGLIALTTDNGLGLDSQTPSVSPDGTKVVYTSKANIGVTTPVSFNIWTMNFNGTSKTALTTNTAAALDSTNPKYSPDQTQIAFQSLMNVGAVASSSFNIWTMTAAGLNQVALTTNTAVGLDSQMPNFSPDNTRIVFYSLQLFNAATPLSNNIWVMKSNGTSQSALTQNTNAGLDSLVGPFAIWYAQ